MDLLRGERGTETARADPGSGASDADLAAVELVREASRLFPASWVRKAGPLVVQAMPEGLGAIGSYDFKARQARVGATLDNAIHQYVHHLQATLPGFQHIFREEHIRRTTRPDGTRKPLKNGKHYEGLFRDGGYVEEYFGAHYPASVVEGADVDLRDAEGLEVPARAFQIVLDSIGGKEWLGKMAQHDSRTLDLVLGTLFEFDP